MTTTDTPSPGPRLWPLFVIVAILIVGQIVTISPQIGNLERFLVMMVTPLMGIVAAAVWLLLLSRLGRAERLTILFGTAAGCAAAAMTIDPTMLPTLLIYGGPIAITLLAIALFATRSRPPRVRCGVALVLIALGWMTLNLGRLDGFDGSYRPGLLWRWDSTTEELFAARTTIGAADVPTIDATRPLVPGPGDWPAFRGPARDSRVTGDRVARDWATHPPRERWRIPVGPAWSSFAHIDGWLFTQEQRGDREAVVAYDAGTGVERWAYLSDGRFTDMVAGPGPRATPTFADGRLYTFGALATLTCLDAATGALIWSRDLMTEIDAALPPWGFAGSPLIVSNRVIIYAGGTEDRGLVAYDATTGAPAWHAPATGINFASAQPVTLAGVPLVLFTGTDALLALDPVTGVEQWRSTPTGWQGTPMVQPQVVDPGDAIIVPLGDGAGLARIDVESSGDGWRITERWSSRRMKASYNDFVFHDGHLYGFDKSIFTCIDAATGAARWRKGRYGFGQVLLLADSATLLIVSEAGDLVLLAADPESHVELGRVKALAGKTWNHPIVVGDRLFVRNGEEAVCYDVGAE